MRKIVLITGGSRGIGAACVRRFARDGAAVIFLYRENEAAAAALEKDCREQGLDARGIRCDVADGAQVRQAVESVLRLYHRVDVLVNNAGVACISLLTDMAEEDIGRLLDVDLKGTILMSRAVLPGMISRGSGCILNVASMWGEVGASCEAVYSAAKAGVIGFTKALAKEVGPSGIRVNCLSPGVIDTDMNRGLTDETREELKEETPLGRLGTPEEAAEAAVFLCGEGASFITGQVLGVSGGMVV